MTTITGKILAISISTVRGGPKQNVASAELVPDWGIVGDAHGGDWHRQVSLLAWESIQRLPRTELKLKPGMFAENITTQGLELNRLSLGAQLRLGDKILLEVTQIGKECHQPCHIFRQLGHCLMPKEGVFARVIQGGSIKIGQVVRVERRG